MPPQQIFDDKVRYAAGLIFTLFALVSYHRGMDNVQELTSVQDMNDVIFWFTVTMAGVYFLTAMLSLMALHGILMELRQLLLPWMAFEVCKMVVLLLLLFWSVYIWKTTMMYGLIVTEVLLQGCWLVVHAYFRKMGRVRII